MTLAPILRTVQRAVRILPLLFLLVACAPTESNTSSSGLPPEAIATLSLIQDGGPFPYSKDGSTFQNRERLLPARPRGYYREYTVPTPGANDRGARRIVTGGRPPEVFYYTADHYRSFRRIEPRP
ncbi:MAG: ribonuclease domain-containing protein [Azoarcus sp.]|jgi:guanyl-specific ribonuclease Sa|nr:ribonuclease domain-containing protein [Azoarcus sp.]